MREKPVYLRGLPAQLVREAKALAAHRGVTLAALVIDALSRTVSEEEAVHAQSPVTPSEMKRALRWFEGNREHLAPELGGQYIAIVDDAVLDHDADFDALAQRVFARVGARDVFMPFVPAAGARVEPLRVRSPRVQALASGGTRSPSQRPTDGDSHRPGPARRHARSTVTR